MNFHSALFVFVACLLLGCNSVQKSVAPGGEGPIPRGTNRDIDEDTIRSPGSDTSRFSVPDSAVAQ